jgi:beta-mannosidase
MLGRVAVARTSAAAFSQWRRHGSACAGALVWVLRDLWAGAGWGLLDEQGAPKSSWHALSAVLQPVALLLTDEGLNGLHLHMPNDSARPVAARLQVRTWRGEQLMEQAERDCVLQPRSTARVAVQTLFDHFVDMSWAYRFGPPPFDVLFATLRAEDGTLLGEATHLSEGFAGPVMVDPQLKALWHRLDDGAAEAVLQARTVALAVHFELEGWRADTAYFDLAPGASRQVRLTRAASSQGAVFDGVRGCVRAANALRPVLLQAA